MIFTFSQKFKKQFKRLDSKTKVRFNERMSIFLNDQYDQILNNHKLHGEFADLRSINITSDIRVVYKKISKDEILLYQIGTHSELYT